MAVTVGHIGREHLQAVRVLWRANSRTLGMFPDGAFEDAFARGNVIGAIDLDKGCIGYLLYRVSRGTAAIVHLCVAEGNRRSGVAASLVRHLIGATSQLGGISLRCREDFDASGFWPKMGFQVSRHVRGRSRDGSVLVIWWREHAERNLFTVAVEEQIARRTPVAIDLNVFYDLTDNEVFENPSKALLADWLTDEVQFWLTTESDIEFGRLPAEMRMENERKARQFGRLPVHSSRFDSVHRELLAVFPSPKSQQDESDVRQVARAITGEARFLLTNDRKMLGIADTVRNRYGMELLSPTELISRLDEIQRSDEYEPVRFAGADLKWTKLRAEGMETAVRTFANSKAQEGHGCLRDRLRLYLATPDRYDAHVVEDGMRPLGLAISCVSPSHPSCLDVMLLRTVHGREGSTLARQLVRQVILAAVSRGKALVHIVDECPSQAVLEALQEFGFFQSLPGWMKMNVLHAGTADELAAHVAAIDHPAVEYEGVDELAQSVRHVSSAEETAYYERWLWPGKVCSDHLPTYIVPIQPAWAVELLGESLGGAKLFGRLQRLALNVEGVYYRSARPRLAAPARILWYVSADAGEEVSAVGAVSLLDAAEIGLPKDLYRAYKRLGIYQWAQVLETADGDVNKPIMAVRFCATELFTEPMPHKVVKAMLASEFSVRTNFEGPTRVPEQAFLKIYHACCR